MSNANSILLNRFFTRNTFRQVIEDGESPAYVATVRKYIVDYTSKTNKECISEIYKHLKKEYQNEYYYKNTLLNKLLLGVHSLKTTAALTEVPVGNSKADFILINGEAVVYEIKTELDNFDRLNGQIADYYKAFSKVVVVTSEHNFDYIQRRLYGTPVGICLLTRKGALSIRKEPSEHSDMLSRTTMFRILRKQEYEQILLKCVGSLPDVSQFEYYRYCQAMFESLPIDTAYNMFTQMLKLRANIDATEYSKIPYELKFLIYFSNYKKSDYAKFCSFLNT